MRYDGARLADFSVKEEKQGRGRMDLSFLLLVLGLLAIGVLMVLSSSFPRAYYDPGLITGGNAA